MKFCPLILIMFLAGFAQSAAPQNAKAPPGRVRQNPKDGLRYVWIPAGTFMMGCSAGDNECIEDEKPSHQVTLTKGFWIGQTEVTVGAYMGFAKMAAKQMPPAPNANLGWANEKVPMVAVSWDDAQDYCTWAGGRLPTEAEWEYAARGGSPAARYGPIEEVAWWAGNSGGQTHEVAQKRANAFGLFDMLGNAWEWVGDWYDEAYFRNSPPKDPSGPSGGRKRVLRGGSWGARPDYVRVSRRISGVPFNWNNSYFGFRCASGSN